ncbi:MAG: hypothetical protein RBS77_05655 [Candidatus Moranbacteria bacterium]|nr:hypothetical protein [Candidatus Moranbacteria bacterium]
MTNMIRSVKSTLNFFLAMLELFISIILAIKVFQSDVSLDNGVIKCILDFLGMMNGGGIWLIESCEMTGAISFLLTILSMMIFSQVLFLAVPGIIERGQKDSARINGRQTFKYRKKRFNKNRFFKNPNGYY